MLLQAGWRKIASPENTLLRKLNTLLRKLLTDGWRFLDLAKIARSIEVQLYHLLSISGDLWLQNSVH